MATKKTQKSVSVKKKANRLKGLAAQKHMHDLEFVLPDGTMAKDKEAFLRSMERNFVPAFGKVITRRSGW